MQQHLVVHVRLYEPRFHGTPEWPPAPARLFQALVAGGAHGSLIPEAAMRALEWLEGLPPPTVWAPKAKVGAQVDLFVPNNDLDAKGGNPANIGDIRTKKLLLPRLLQGQPEFTYAWPIPEDSPSANDVLDLAELLYQFGRGIDPAWAVGEIVESDLLYQKMNDSQADFFRPSVGDDSATELPCPASGSLLSLSERFKENRRRLRADGTGKAARTLFTQPPKARFVQVPYECPAHRVVYELQQGSDASRLWPWPLAHAAELVEKLRDGAAERLRNALPEKAALIDSYLIGRKSDGRNSVPPRDRVRIVPLGSIGSEYADRAIRRVAVEVPGTCALRADDVHWAFSGQLSARAETGEVSFVLVESSDSNMLEHYAPVEGAKLWRSVTALALPVASARRRIDPLRRGEEEKSAQERLAEERAAITAVRTALRHAEVRAQVVSTRAQREPFEGRGTHAEAFANGTRFNKHQMWHVEITFDRPVSGPLVIGDGRFLGLGLMAPVQDTHGVWAFRVLSGLTSEANPEELACALRRAVMSRYQAGIGTRAKLPPLVSGHAADGSPLRDKGHLAFQFDPQSQLLLVLAPHVFEQRSPYQNELEALRLLEQTLEGFCELRAGTSGRLVLARASLAEVNHSLFAARQTWASATPYLVTRHAKAGDATDAIIADVRAECERRGLPRPASIGVSDIRGIRGKGLTGMVQLTFATAVSGPILLGKSRHMGGGMFETGPTASEPLPTGKP